MMILFALVAMLTLAALPVVVYADAGAISLGGSLNGDAAGAMRSLKELLRNLIVLLAAFSNFAEDQVIKHFYRTGTITKPTVMAAALYTATPGEAGGGTEVSGGSYARVDLPPLDANWRATSSGDGTTNNLAAITFPAPTANWGVITSLAQLDATSAGNFINWGALTTTKTVNNADAAPAFAIAALSFQVDN